MASGHVNRIKRPNTWLHRPMLHNVKKALANPEPSTHGTFRTCRDFRVEPASGGKAEVGFRVRQGQLLAQSCRSRACLLLGAERTCRICGLRSQFDPNATSDVPPNLLLSRGLDVFQVTSLDRYTVAKYPWGRTRGGRVFVGLDHGAAATLPLTARSP